MHASACAASVHQFRLSVPDWSSLLLPEDATLCFAHLNRRRLLLASLLARANPSVFRAPPLAGLITGPTPARFGRWTNGHHRCGVANLGIDIDLPVGAAETITVNALAGDYNYYCNVPGHEAGDMSGTMHMVKIRPGRKGFLRASSRNVIPKNLGGCPCSVGGRGSRDAGVALALPAPGDASVPPDPGPR